MLPGNCGWHFLFPEKWMHLLLDKVQNKNVE